MCWSKLNDTKLQLVKKLIFLFVCVIFIGEHSLAQNKSVMSYPEIPTVEGLVFRVQFAVSKKLIPVGQFNNVEEVVMGISDKTFSYYSGSFRFFEAAEVYKRELRNLEYNAVVVAFYNGEEMDICEARKTLEKDYWAKEEEEQEEKKEKEEIVNNKTMEQPKSVKSETKKEIVKKQPAVASTGNKNLPVRQADKKTPVASPQKEEKQDSLPVQTEEVKTTPVAISNKVEYRVQIAASQTEISATEKRFKEIEGIYKEKGKDGYYRYFVGKENEMDAAKKLQKKVEEQGITNTFIVYYNNGEKISLAEVKQIQGKK